MNKQRDYTDEELTAFLDGEAQGALSGDIKAALKRDRTLQERLKALDVDKRAVKSAFDGLLAGAPDVPEAIETEIASDGRRSGRWPAAVAATALLCLCAGWLAATKLQGPAQASWQDFAAKYHALYVNSTLSHIRQAPDAAKAELDRVGEALGKRFAYEALSATQRLDYRRAQILGFEGRPLVQLAFLSTVGAPVALCVIRSTGTSARDVRVSTMEGMSAAEWSKDGYDFLLIGGRDRALIDQAARHLKASL